MKKLIATSLAFGMLLGILGEPTSAETKKSIFNRPMNSGCSVKCDMPSFSQASNSDENMTVFYSTQGKFTLQNPDGLAKNSYVSVNIARPRQERKLWAGFRKVNADSGENRFQIRVSEDKAPWWNIPGRIWNWLWKPGVFVKYAIVPTTRDEEKILETPEVKEGQKKKEVLDDENFRKEVEKHNGKDKVTEFKEDYMNKLLNGIKYDPNLDPYDPFNVAETGHVDTLQAALPAIDRKKYYVQREVAEVNKKILEDKNKVLAGLAQKCGDELITEGEVARLSRTNPEQTFRLIVNNNIGEGGEADKLVLILSNLAATGQSINDDSSISFVSYVQSVLPDRFNNPLTDKERGNINRAYEALQAAKYKPGFFKWLWNGIKYITPDVVKDFICWIGNEITFGALSEKKQLLKTDNDISAKQEELMNLEKDVAEATKNLEATNKELDEVRKKLDDRTTDLAHRETLLEQQQSLIDLQLQSQKRLSNMQNQLRSTRAARDRANTERDRANTERDRANNEREQANTERDRANTELERALVALNAARDQEAQARMQKNMALDQLNEINEEIAELEKQQQKQQQQQKQKQKKKKGWK